MNWQPIETPPKDGQSALIYSKKYGGIIIVAYYDLGYWHDESGQSVTGITHWMPLPEPPQ